MNTPARPETDPAPAVTPPHLYVRALVVDGSTEQQQSARNLLVQLGCQVDVAADEQLAVALSQIVRYHLIFVDGSILAGMGDSSVLRDLEVDGRCISVVSMLENPTATTSHRHTQMGANDTICKPLTARNLKSAMATWLKRGPVDIAHRV